MNFSTDQAKGTGIFVIILLGILGLAISIGLFFLIRAIVCWYFKLNKIVAELKAIDTHLAAIANMTEQSLNAQQKIAFNSSQAAPVAPVAPAPAPFAAAPVAPAPAPFEAAPVAPVVPAPAPFEAAPVAPVVPAPVVEPAPFANAVSFDNATAGGTETLASFVANEVPVYTPPVPEVAAAPAARFCVNCGTKLQDGASFCMECGTRN